MHYSIKEVLQVKNFTSSKLELNIDTLRGSTNPGLLVSDVKKSGWKLYPKKNKNAEMYRKQDHNIVFEYYPVKNTLTVEFSLTRLMFGSNTKVFNFDDLSLFYQVINLLIEDVVKGVFVVDSFSMWNMTRLDINVDIPLKLHNDYKIYLDFFKKIKISRMRSYEYETGDKQVNKSQSFVAYEKKTQILSKSPAKITDEDNEFLEDNNSNVLRLESQYKRYKLERFFPKKRKIENILDPQVILSVYNKSVKTLGLELELLTKNDLFELIDTVYKKTKARNMKRLIEDLNELPFEKFKKLHSIDNLGRYRRELKALNVNIYYLSGKPSAIIDFSGLRIYNPIDNTYSSSSSYLLVTLIQMTAVSLVPLSLHIFSYMRGFSRPPPQNCRSQ